MSFLHQTVLPFLAFAVLSISEVLAEICEDGRSCTAPEHCCLSGCCYSGDEDDDRYAYGYRMSVWNMWYFWFVILFIMMSCFGGCGYYKQRQRVLRSQPGTGFLSVFQLPSRRRDPDMGTVTLQTSYPVAAYGFSHTRATPDIQTTVNLNPPPYSEVMSNPDQFPANIKSSLPGNPTERVIPSAMPACQQIYSNQTDATTNQMPQPPPYSEVVANQDGATHVVTMPSQPSQQNVIGQE